MDTIKIMKVFAIQGSCDPFIVDLTRRIIKNVEVKNQFEQANEILRWLKAHIKYVDDVRNIDTVMHPVLIARDYKQGDCDDMSTLCAAMLLSINIPARFAIIKISSNEYEHVYAEAYVNGKWYAMDPVYRDAYLGWEYGLGKAKQTLAIDVLDKDLAQAFASNLANGGDSWMGLWNNITKALQNVYSAYERGDITKDDLELAVQAMYTVVPQEGAGITGETVKRIPAYCRLARFTMTTVDFVKNPLVQSVFIGIAGIYLLSRIRRS